VGPGEIYVKQGPEDINGIGSIVCSLRVRGQLDDTVQGSIKMSGFVCELAKYSNMSLNGTNMIFMREKIWDSS